MYPECTFLSAVMPARRVAPVFASGGQQALEVGDRRVVFEFLGADTNWYHQASSQKWGFFSLPWPCRTYTPSLADQNIATPNGYLVGRDAPSFPVFQGAFAAFFTDDYAMTGAALAPRGQVDLRLVDQRARIRRIKVGVTSLDTWVDGRSIGGTRLELNSSTVRGEVVVERTGKVTFPLPGGLGQDAWLWLKDDSGWLDLRSLAAWGGHLSPDVEFDAANDPVEELTLLATQGENLHLEYKSELPGDSKESKRRSLKTVVAFANGEGGTLLFGVEGDDVVGRIVGVTGRPADQVRRLDALVRDLVTPRPRVHVAAHDIEGKVVIRVNVEPGGGVLHALRLEANRPDYYVRRNGSTYYADPDELAAIVHSASPVPTLDYYRLG